MHNLHILSVTFLAMFNLIQPLGWGVVCSRLCPLVLFLLSFPVFSIPAESPSVVLPAGSRTPIASVLDQLRAAHGPEFVLAQDVHGVIVSQATTQLTLDYLIHEFLPANGFYTYRSPEKEAVIVSRDLVERHIPLPREVNRGLRRAAGFLLGATQTLDFYQALEQVLLGQEEEGVLKVEWPERSLRLTTQPSELILRDTRNRAHRIQEALTRLAPDLAKTPPLPLVLKAIPLETTLGQPFISALDENLFGGSGFDGNSWDGTPYLAKSEDGKVLVMGHTTAGIEQARQLASQHPYKISLPDLVLTSRRYDAVPGKIQRDLSHSAAYQRKQQVEHLCELFETILYEPGTHAEAASRGRLLIPNPDTGSIVVIDTPDNIKKIDEYMQYRDISTGATTARYGKSSGPQIRAVQVKSRAIDQAARAFGLEP